MSELELPEKMGRYEITGVLGKGAMGVVYEGRDPNIGRRVAIKTARRDLMEASGMAEEMMQRFLREAQAAGSLSHPNVITIYDAGEEGDTAYIAMEFLEGGDLRQWFARREALEVEEVVEAAAQVCDGLAAVHESGVIHRDIKPANIMTPTDMPVKVADFGIAHVSDSTLTADGALIGTPHYMSPEQFMGHKLDGRSDLFSVAIILYELLTGQKPFAGEALSTVMHLCIKTQPKPPNELDPRVSDVLNSVIMKALSKDPEERYSDGLAMAAALRECLKENPDSAVLALDASPAAGAKKQRSNAVETTEPYPSLDLSDTASEQTLRGVVHARAEAETDIQRNAKSKSLPIAVTGLAVLVVLGGIFVWQFADNSTPAAVPRNESSVPATQAEGLESVLAEAHTTGVADVKLEFDAIPDATDRARYLEDADAQPLEGGQIRAEHPKTGEVYDTQALDASGETASLLSIPAEVEWVRFVIVGPDGQMLDDPVVRDWAHRQVFLIPAMT